MLFKISPTIFFTYISLAIVTGWDEGVAQMSVGEKANITCPPEYAYGKDGAGGGLIPPNATLVFVVEMLGIK